MLTRRKALEILRKEFPYFYSVYGVKKIGLFGSFAKETQKKGSDIDIVVEFERPIGFKFLEFAEYIEKRLGKKVEILTPEGIKGIRVKEVAAEIKRSLVYV